MEQGVNNVIRLTDTTKSISDFMVTTNLLRAKNEKPDVLLIMNGPPQFLASVLFENQPDITDKFFSVDCLIFISCP
jgi:hypothetical protein